MQKHTDLLGFKVLDENVVRKQIRQVIKEASCRQKSQELADSYSLEELQSRLDQIMMDMEQEAEPDGGPIADMYADEMDAYEGAIRLASNPFEKDSVGGMTYDDMLKKHYPSKDEFTKSSEFDRDMEEQNITGGDVAFNPGDSPAYSTPSAFASSRTRWKRKNEKYAE